MRGSGPGICPLFGLAWGSAVGTSGAAEKRPACTGLAGYAMITLADRVLLTAAPVFPLALIAAWLWPALRERMSILSIVAPVPALFASVLAAGAPRVTFWRGLVPITLMVNTLGAILLGTLCLLWIAGAVYAARSWRNTPAGWQFAICWLLTLAGSIGAFVAADLASFFLSYTLVSPTRSGHRSGPCGSGRCWLFCCLDGKIVGRPRATPISTIPALCSRGQPMGLAEQSSAPRPDCGNGRRPPCRSCLSQFGWVLPCW